MMSSDFIYQTDNTNNKELISLLIKIVNEWSNKLPHHPYGNFGDKIKIESLIYTPSYPILLDTQFEKRTKTEEFIPYDNREIPDRKFYNLDDIIVWDWNLKTIEKYTDDEFNYFATGSEHIENCHHCNAKGWIICTSCNGNKRITCPSCNGAGKVKCSSCSGKGYHRCTSCNGTGRNEYQAKCPTCNGSGLILNDGTFSTAQMSDRRYVNCPTCHGKKYDVKHTSCSNCGGTGKKKCTKCSGSGEVTCTACHGHKTITCPKCKGTGQIICSTCQGKQQLLHYININQSFSTDTQKDALHHRNISAKFPEFFDNWNSYESELIFSVRRDKISLDDLPADTHLESMFKNHLKKAELLCSDSQEIIFQDLDIRKIDVWLLKYTFQGKSYTFAFCGNNKKLISGTNPITEFSSGLLNQAFAAAKKRSYAKAYRLAKKSKDIGIYEQKKRTANQLNKLREKIFQTYYLGAKTGAIFAALILGFLAFSYFKNINYVLPWAEFINTPDNFLFNIHPWAMAAFTAWLVFKLGKSLGQKSCNIIGVRSGALFRYSLGIITSLFFSILIVGLIVLLNTTGVTAIASFLGWLSYWVVKIVILIIGSVIGLFIWLFGLIF